MKSGLVFNKSYHNFVAEFFQKHTGRQVNVQCHTFTLEFGTVLDSVNMAQIQSAKSSYIKVNVWSSV